MKIIVIKERGNILLPANDEAENVLSTLINGYEFHIDVVKKRNLKFHKKLFGLLKLILDNQRYYKTIDNVLEIVKFRAGYYDTIVTHKGKKHYKTKSISFDNMDDIEFKKFYSNALDVGFELCGTYDFEKELVGFI